ncbi:Asp23/Gls24 family envelope stress response protein [Amycolatopsis sp. K13G38]|uniref:Asp23/Gls24 family envelope stress response protein n=1 Tax=Amycolatopsis acididurans TaxID=2724524 RepID=A0ABX1IXA4_9PSEU|nr:Asp23/Gls24 family envelope stress response protein [Amycolatopsis acididurans]NKQ52131.1 Asp23/Gls24 family envelope stress response protein [Amycolatopsis acididurans]
MAIEWAIEEPVVAGIAAHAARGIPGVARLETGVGGLLRAWGRSKWQQAKGITPVATDGVAVRVDGESVRVRVGIATSGHAQAAVVARRVQREVRQAITRDTGLTVDEVSVAVLDIEPASTS